MAQAFYFAMDCPSCDETIHQGINIALDEHGGLPVIPFDMAAQEKFECECGTVVFTADMPTYDQESL